MLLFQYPFLLTALALCLVLVGIHAYLGYHVVRRGVIFVDLALAQMAALGASVAAALGLHEAPEWQTWAVSLLFALIGAGLFSTFRTRAQRVPVEALIGIAYAGAVALSMVLLEKSATGTEEIKEMLVGTLLTASWAHVGIVALLYGSVGLVHWAARRPLFAITEDPEAARAAGVRLRLWDFVFYATFAVVVTTSVRVAGVLMVFALLIIPSCAALLWKGGTAARLSFAWGFGALASVAGLELSTRLDWPAAPTVILALLGLFALWSAWPRRE